MAEIIGRPTVQLDITMRLSEKEARALHDLSGYGVDAFIKAFYEFLGKAYLEKHEDGLRSLLKSAKDLLPSPLHHATEARKLFHAPIPPVQSEDLKL